MFQRFEKELSTLNQFIAENLIELFDRKYEFVINSPVETFMLDLKGFMEFINEDELISDFTGKLVQQLNARGEQYRQKLEEEKALAIEIKDAMVKAYPGIDDSNRTREGIADMSWAYSLAAFNKIAAESYRSGIPLERDPLDDDTDSHLLIRILLMKMGKLDEMEKTGEVTVDPEMRIKLNNLDAAHKFTHLDFVNYCRTSAGIAWLKLMEIVKRINPDPKDAGRWSKMSFEEIGNAAFKEWLKGKPYEWVSDVTYGAVTRWANYTPAGLSDAAIAKRIEDQNTTLKRVYEAVRQEIGTTRLYLQLLDRYRIRCQWYNQQHLREELLDAEGNLIRNREDVLTRDLALYLYDQGVTAIYRSRFGQHEFDLLELDAKRPMFVEAKVYRDSTAKADLVAGIGQLHGYLSAYEAHKNISEAYYVIYRVGGPIYEFPRKIKTNRFSLYPILIDLGPSEESGSRQRRPIIVTEAEIIDSIKNEEPDSKANEALKETTST